MRLLFAIVLAAGYLAGGAVASAQVPALPGLPEAIPAPLPPPSQPPLILGPLTRSPFINGSATQSTDASAPVMQSPFGTATPSAITAGPVTQMPFADRRQRTAAGAEPVCQRPRDADPVAGRAVASAARYIQRSLDTVPTVGRQLWPERVKSQYLLQRLRKRLTKRWVLPPSLPGSPCRFVPPEAARAQERANHSNRRKVIASRIGTFRHGLISPNRLW